MKLLRWVLVLKSIFPSACIGKEFSFSADPGSHIVLGLDYGEFFSGDKYAEYRVGFYPVSHLYISEEATRKFVFSVKMRADFSKPESGSEFFEWQLIDCGCRSEGLQVKYRTTEKEAELDFSIVHEVSGLGDLRIEMEEGLTKISAPFDLNFESFQLQIYVTRDVEVLKRRVPLPRVVVADWENFRVLSGE